MQSNFFAAADVYKNNCNILVHFVSLLLQYLDSFKLFVKGVIIFLKKHQNLAFIYVTASYSK